ncbi:Probable transporter [Actinomycetales bacterium JB111]|nr:Probable transporter [Actinomycetales bacterium JB111]
MAADGPMFPMRSVVLGAFVPSFLAEIGVGAALPIIVTYATDHGASLGLASFLAALVPVGQILADFPAGVVVARLGDRRAMMAASIVAIAAFAAALVGGSLLVLGIAALVLGASQSVFAIARHAYLTVATPPQRRARVLSTLAGVHRTGRFVGPFIGAAVLLFASNRWAFAVGVVTSLLALVALIAVGDTDADLPERAGRRAGRLAGLRARRRGADVDGSDRPSPPRGPSFAQVLKVNREVLTRLGSVALLVALVRGARQTVLPIWGEHIGLDGATISVIFGVAAGMDMLLFYPSGHAMDRLGRMWVGLPGMAVMGVALALIPFTAGAAGLGAVGLLLGFGNGITSGILMTLGSDAAPAQGQAQFLAAWRLQGDLGQAASPLLLSAGPVIGSLAAVVWVTAGAAALAMAAMIRWLPRYSVHANRTTRRRAGLTPDGSRPLDLGE